MRRLLPVIHYRDDSTTMLNVDTAMDAGCQGVWLINMHGKSASLDPVANRIRSEFPDLWLGVNRLDTGPSAALAVEQGRTLYDTLWADNPGLHSTDGDEWEVAAISREIENFVGRRAPVAFYGSVAFKTQRPEPKPGETARRAAELGWVVTTSGVATGRAPSVDHVAAVSEGARQVSGARVAVASGITPVNVGVFLPLVDDYLVATGISSDFYTLSPDLTRRLADRVHGA